MRSTLLRSVDVRTRLPWGAKAAIVALCCVMARCAVPVPEPVCPVPGLYGPGHMVWVGADLYKISGYACAPDGAVVLLVGARGQRWASVDELAGDGVQAWLK